MFVITADQIGSRADVDRSAAMQADLQAEFGEALLLPVDQTAGDEVQALTSDATTALDLVLHLARDGHWSIGLGVGGIRTPLPDAVRKASGPAFIAARDAVEAAKRADGRFALRVPEELGDRIAADARPAAHVEALLRLLLVLRARRSDAGWEVADLVADGRSQKDAAAALGVTDAAVSQRLKSALWNVDRQSIPALVRLLDELDRAAR
ncbi:DNA-binding protein [Agromyces sp. CFH 90414]|uniref:DNA-binding protein n=1 Tax=Agromyces agglutinans TaxID=2662258 RepID=A0A6I2FCS0_9MICO|nr:DNA-binding protein [Agromyces agglutinans]MRG61587.1 DNA-binding protein [Agromyces agglutinans]